MSKDVSEKILDATMEVIAKEKISGTRMHLIAKEANMTQSNLHYYYPTKNNLLIALLNKLQDGFSENRKKVVSAEKALEENIRAIFDEKKEVTLHNKKLDYLQFDFWVQGTVDPEVRATFQKTFDIWRRDIRDLVANGKTAEAANSMERMLPYLMVSLMMGASMQYLIDEGSFDLDEYFGIAQKMVLGLLEADNK